jgi:DNA-binding GntR family transcriptional regulator
LPHSLSRLEPSTLSEECYRVLKEAILNLDLSPGTPLVEHQLAAQLGISKTPVREALARLEGERLVETSPNGRQSKVSHLPMKKIREVYQIRLWLEPAILRDTGHNLTDQELNDLEEFIQDSATAVELDGLSGFIDSNDAFHLYLVRRTGNETLMSQMRRTFQHIQRIRAALRRAALKEVQHHRATREALESHRKILEALAVGDAELAAQRMRHDIQLFVNLLESGVLSRALEPLTSVRPDER